jgi:hypothetical protein
VALAYAAGYAIGYLTPGAPGEVGIREALLVLMLGAALDTGLVAISAVSSASATSPPRPGSGSVRSGGCVELRRCRRRDRAGGDAGAARAI